MNWLKIVAALALLITTSAFAETIGIRFVVSDELGQSAAQRQSTQAALEKYVAEINDYYRNSEVVLRAEIVDVEFSRIAATDALQILNDMAHEQDGFAAMFQKANEYGADYTIAVIDKLMLRGNRNCGRGYMQNSTREAISSTRLAFAAIDFVCGAHTLAHELGHLMGLNHGYLVDQCQPAMGHTTAIAPYANGYGVGNCDGKPQPGEFGTIMVGGWMKTINGDGHGNLPIFSNPLIKDERCGVSKICGDPAIGDEARALNENARYYAAHEEPDVHTLHYGSAELAACVKQKYRGKEIVDLEELICPSAGVGSLAGVERLGALRRIDLSGNRVEDVSPLMALPTDRVDRIDLRGNNRITCKSLDGLAARFVGKVVWPASCLQQ